MNFKNLSGEINDMCVFVLKIGDGIIIMNLSENFYSKEIFFPFANTFHTNYIVFLYSK